MDAVFTPCDSRAPLVRVPCIRQMGHDGAHCGTGSVIEWHDHEPNTLIEKLAGADE